MLAESLSPLAIKDSSYAFFCGANAFMDLFISQQSAQIRVTLLLKPHKELSLLSLIYVCASIKY
jgi:hypothetical protein